VGAIIEARTDFLSQLGIRSAHFAWEDGEGQDLNGLLVGRNEIQGSRYHEEAGPGASFMQGFTPNSKAALNDQSWGR
jgi:hypothetical protein